LKMARMVSVRLENFADVLTLEGRPEFVRLKK
jgi:hypothetical protein